MIETMTRQKRVRVHRSELNGQKHSEEELIRDLRALGVSREALHTTLKNEGQERLRQVITSQAYLDEHGEPKPIYFHPAPGAVYETYLHNLDKCNLVYNLFMKECFLAAMVVDTIKISNAEGLVQDEFFDPFTTADPYLFVPDFATAVGRGNSEYERSVPFYKIEEYLFSLQNKSGISWVLQGSGSPESELVGWSPLFMSYLYKHALIIPIEA